MINAKLEKKISNKAKPGQETKPYNEIETIKIDGHMHIGRTANFCISSPRADSLVKSMDYIGIKIGCISSIYSWGPDMTLGNELVKEACRKYPGRFIGQIGVNPHYTEELMKELEKYRYDKDFRQIKIHPEVSQYPFWGENYHLVYQFAAEYGYSVLTHTWGEKDIKDAVKIAEKYSDMELILGHSGGTLNGIEEAIKAANNHSNIYLDLTCSWNYQGLVELLVQEVCVDKLLFGSDATFNSQSAAYGKILFADIKQGDKEKILGINNAKLLKLDY